MKKVNLRWLLWLTAVFLTISLAACNQTNATTPTGMAIADTAVPTQTPLPTATPIPPC